MGSPADDGIAAAKLDNAKADGYVSDDDNPEYLFGGINTSILVQALNGDIDLDELVRAEMINRGLDKKGVWVGFGRAKAIHTDQGFKPIERI